MATVTTWNTSRCRCRCLNSLIRNLNRAHDVFGPRTATGGPLFPCLTCLDTTKFMLLSVTRRDGNFENIEATTLLELKMFTSGFRPWRIDYSFVCMLISPLCLVYKCKKQKNFEVKMKQRGLIYMQTKE